MDSPQATIVTNRISSLEDGTETSLKRVENHWSRQERSKPTGGIHGSPPDQKQPPGRNEFLGIPPGMVSIPNICWSGARTKPNTTTSMLPFVNTISRWAGSRPTTWWTRLRRGLGVFADSYGVRAVRLNALLLRIATIFSNQEQPISQAPSPYRRGALK